MISRNAVPFMLLMKSLCLALLLHCAGSLAVAQKPGDDLKLYYACKVWGFVKYHHSSVSNCRVPWDEALQQFFPAMKAAESNDAFNDALDSLLHAAGPMERATTPAPPPLPEELRRNRRFSWMDDSFLRQDVRASLQDILDNFRPHPICWVAQNPEGPGSYGWLAFPKDAPCISLDARSTFPDEFHRVLLLFKYWNIIEYFNPNRHLADVSWDSTLLRRSGAIVSAATYPAFYDAVNRFAAALNDAHVSTSSAAYPVQTYSPKIVLRHVEGAYRIVKSAYPEISRGDKLLGIDGHTMTEIEDSLRPMLSAGTPAAFTDYLASYVKRGAQGSPIRIDYEDSAGGAHTLNAYRYTYAGNSFFTLYVPNDSLGAVPWRRWNCDIGYVNMSMLQPRDVPLMYDALKKTKAIIFDLRKYPIGAERDIAQLMYPGERSVSRVLRPDPKYPGTTSPIEDVLGRPDVRDPYKGKVIVLSNHGTVSQGEYSCMILQAMPGAIVVGSQTTGADGNVSMVDLSKDLRTYFTTLGVYYPDGRATQRVGIVPDTLVLPTVQGVRQGRDEELEKALEIAGCPVVTRIETMPVPATGRELHSYPNPFSEATTLTVSKPEAAPSALIVCDALGRVVLERSSAFANGVPLTIHAWELPGPGVYYCRTRIGTETLSTVLLHVQ